MLARINDTLEVMQSTAQEKTGVKIPDIPAYVLWITVGLLVIVVIQTLLGKAPDEEENLVEEKGDHPTHPKIAAICFGIVVVYVWLLSLKILPWTILSTIMIVLVGGIMARWQARKLIVIGELALIASLGTAYLFTEVLTGVILP